MRFFAVWGYLAWRNSLATLMRSLAPLRKAQRSVACWLLQHGDYRWFLVLAAWAEGCGWATGGSIGVLLWPPPISSACLAMAVNWILPG